MSRSLTRNNLSAHSISQLAVNPLPGAAGVGGCSKNATLLYKKRAACIISLMGMCSAVTVDQIIW